MNGRIDVLHPDQVWCTGRSCFFIGLTRDGKNRHMGFPVYKDTTGRRVAIRGAS